MATVFKSKMDAWLRVVLVVAMVASVAGAVAVVSLGSRARWWIAGATVTLGVGLPLWLLLTTRYTLVADVLLVRAGPFTWRIAVDDITGITPTTNPLSSPALSLDRLRIDYGRGRSLMISPRDPEAFVRAVEGARRPAGRNNQ